MISRSAWRGEKRGNSAPKRAMSYFGAATDMNSMPQQAVTNGYWNSEYFRAQFVASTSLVVTLSMNPMAIPNLPRVYAKHRPARRSEGS
jgi:hypothetical protein